MRLRPLLVLKLFLWAACLAPLGVLVYDAFTGNLAAEAVKDIQHRTGLTALIILFVALTVTPVRRLSGWNEVIRLRRPLGLFAFFYAFLHAFSYFVFDQMMNPADIAEDVMKRPWVTVGFTAFVLMVPLAVTSTTGWIRRLGKRWQQLHRLVYVIAALGVFHFLWLVKRDVSEPVTYGLILAAILASRLVLNRIPTARKPVRRPAEVELAEADGRS